MKYPLIFITFCVLFSVHLGYTASVAIPSDDKIVSLRPSVDRKTVLDSWAPLPAYTQQTLENFKNGLPRGILCVHSYEVIFDGVSNHFRKKWETVHPNDQKRPFLEQAFVDHYVDYLLASRPLISTSLLSFHDEKVFTNSSTFGTISLILSVPPQCVTFTSHRDSYTPFDYWMQRPSSNQLRKYDSYLNSTLSPLDSIMRFSNVESSYSDQGEVYYPVMNEIGVLSCANVMGKFYRPSVVGILINPHELPQPPSDLGNGEYNKRLERAARTWAENNGLPIIDLGSLDPCFFPKNTLDTPVEEWMILQTPEFTADDYINRHDLRKRDLSTKNFRLSEEQWKGYGLRPHST